MPYNSKPLKRDGSGSRVPIPQFFNPTEDDYNPLTGANLGAGRYGADNLIWGKTPGGIYAPVAVDANGHILSSAKIVDADGEQVTVTNGKLDVNAQVTVDAIIAGETIVTAPLTRIVTLTDTPVALTSKSNLRQITIRNIDLVLRCRLGETGMTAANGKGIALEPQATYQESFDPATPVTIYGRSEGASMQVEVYEA